MCSSGNDLGFKYQKPQGGHRCGLTWQTEPSNTTMQPPWRKCSSLALMWGLLKPQGSLSSSCDQSTFRLFVDATGDYSPGRASFFDPPALFGSRHHDCRSLSRDEHVSGNCFRADRAPSRTGGQIFLNPERTSSEGSSWVIRKEMCRFVHGCVSKHLQRTSCSRALFVPRGVEQSGNASASEQSRLNWVPEYHTRVLWVQC
ncbi:hypothetical protein R6Z07F_003878 [Ovis aries]